MKIWQFYGECGILNALIKETRKQGGTIIKRL